MKQSWTFHASVSAKLDLIARACLIWECFAEAIIFCVDVCVLSTHHTQSRAEHCWNRDIPGFPTFALARHCVPPCAQTRTMAGQKKALPIQIAEWLCSVADCACKQSQIFHWITTLPSFFIDFLRVFLFFIETNFMDVTHEGQQPKAPDTQQLQICAIVATQIAKMVDNPFTCEALFVWSLVGLAWNHCRWTCLQSRPRLPSVQSGCSNNNTGTHTTNNTTTNTDDDKFGSSSNNNDDDDNDMNDKNQNGNSNEQHTNSSSKMYIAQTNATASTAPSVKLKTVYHICKYPVWQNDTQ